jgi:hypothetical protein
MISIYSKHGKHKRVGKFKSWWKAGEWIEKHWPKHKLKDPNYFIKTTKS